VTQPAGRPAPAVLAEIVRRVVEVADPDRIILFGSAARGDMGPDSDVDLLVVKSGVPHRRRLAQQIYTNLFGVTVPVDVVVVAPEDIERLAGKVGTIITPALEEGREIYVR
jgi:predicted nucleotidyltransferase